MIIASSCLIFLTSHLIQWHSLCLVKYDWFKHSLSFPSLPSLRLYICVFLNSVTCSGLSTWAKDLMSLDITLRFISCDPVIHDYSGWFLWRPHVGSLKWSSARLGEKHRTLQLSGVWWVSPTIYSVTMHPVSQWRHSYSHYCHPTSPPLLVHQPG